MKRSSSQWPRRQHQGRRPPSARSSARRRCGAARRAESRGRVVPPMRAIAEANRRSAITSGDVAIAACVAARKYSQGSWFAVGERRRRLHQSALLRMAPLPAISPRPVCGHAAAWRRRRASALNHPRHAASARNGPDRRVIFASASTQANTRASFAVTNRAAQSRLRACNVLPCSLEQWRYSAPFEGMFSRAATSYWASRPSRGINAGRLMAAPLTATRHRALVKSAVRR